MDRFGKRENTQNDEEVQREGRETEDRHTHTEYRRGVTEGESQENYIKDNQSRIITEGDDTGEHHKRRTHTAKKGAHRRHGNVCAYKR